MAVDGVDGDAPAASVALAPPQLECYFDGVPACAYYSPCRAHPPDWHGTMNWARSGNHPSSRETQAVAVAPRIQAILGGSHPIVDQAPTHPKHFQLCRWCAVAPQTSSSCRSCAWTYVSCPWSARSPFLSTNGHCDSYDRAPHDSSTIDVVCPGCPQDVVAGHFHSPQMSPQLE